MIAARIYTRAFVTLSLIAAAVSVAFAQLRPGARVNDTHAEARCEPFEVWVSILERDRRGEPAPAPSVFAAWRRGYGDAAIIRAVRDVGRRNALTVDLVNRVLLARGQGSFLTVDEVVRDGAGV